MPNCTKLKIGDTVRIIFKNGTEKLKVIDSIVGHVITLKGMSSIKFKSTNGEALISSTTKKQVIHADLLYCRIEPL